MVKERHKQGVFNVSGFAHAAEYIPLCVFEEAAAGGNGVESGGGGMEKTG
jgi:hypothetical protein